MMRFSRWGWNIMEFIWYIAIALMITVVIVIIVASLIARL